MIKKKLFLETFVLLMVVGVLNFVATENNLYWKINEFDSMMHFLGGAFVSFFFLWFYFFSGFFNPIDKKLKDFIYVSLLGLLFIGVTWEIYELLLGEASFWGNVYPYDTAMDLIMDTLGAIAACLYSYIKVLKSE